MPSQRLAGSMLGMPSVWGALIQWKAEAVEPGAPNVAPYESQSGGVVEALKGPLLREI